MAAEISTSTRSDLPNARHQPRAGKNSVVKSGGEPEAGWDKGREVCIKVTKKPEGRRPGGGPPGVGGYLGAGALIWASEASTFFSPQVGVSAVAGRKVANRPLACS